MQITAGFLKWGRVVEGNSGLELFPSFSGPPYTPRVHGHSRWPQTQTVWGDFSDSAAFRNQFPAASDSAIREQTALQRKEYYSQGRYLRSCSHPEIGEAMEDEEMNSEPGRTASRGGRTE